jgi:phage N-6-adenine-methyltransferase
MDWATPRAFFAALHSEFRFTLDACADETNACLPNYLSRENDALAADWPGRVYMNPPYGYGIRRWIKKARLESRQNAEVVVCLIPSRTDTSWWHEDVLAASEIRFIKGRMRFSGSQINAPFPCAVVVFDRLSDKSEPKYSVMDRILDVGVAAIPPATVRDEDDPAPEPDICDQADADYDWYELTHD